MFVWKIQYRATKAGKSRETIINHIVNYLSEKYIWQIYHHCIRRSTNFHKKLKMMLL